jgi:ribose-phosphate pyrophosphokinase
MDPVIFVGSANLALGAATAESIGLTLGARALARFPDGELHVELQETVRGREVFLVEPTGPPVHEHLFDLFMLADACRRAGAARLIAIIPYFGYARQDRRATGRDPVGGRVVADLLSACGIERVVAMDLHTGSLEGFFPFPLEHLSAVHLLAQAAATSGVPAESVIVAPDLGAVKLAERYARLLRMPIAIVNKTRLSGEEVEAKGIVGEVRGRPILIVDDMISTGGTIAAAVKAALAAGALPDVAVAATHGLFVGSAAKRLGGLGVKRFIVSDSVARSPDLALPIRVVTIAPLLGEAIKRLHTGQSLDHLIAHM